MENGEAGGRTTRSDVGQWRVRGEVCKKEGPEGGGGGGLALGGGQGHKVPQGQTGLESATTQPQRVTSWAHLTGRRGRIGPQFVPPDFQRAGGGCRRGAETAPPAILAELLPGSTTGSFARTWQQPRCRRQLR